MWLPLFRRLFGPRFLIERGGNTAKGEHEVRPYGCEREGQVDPPNIKLCLVARSAQRRANGLFFTIAPNAQFDVVACTAA